MIRIPCYEPAGKVLHLTAEDLTRHVIGLGTTGCGKTTGLINPLLQQVLAWRSGEAQQKVGILVLDPKADDTRDKVRAYAQAAGRLDDVVMLSSADNSYYGYFDDFCRLGQVDEFARRVLYGSQDMGTDNVYWTETRLGLVSSALTILLASGGLLTFERVAEFLRTWFHTTDAAELTEGLQFVQRLLASGKLKPATRRRLQLAMSDAQNWKALDTRTRELHKSVINNALRALLSPAAHDVFDNSKRQRFNPAEVLSGKILVASMNAVCHPELTALLFRALKRDYYAAVLSRIAFRPEHDRLCGLVLDELPLSVMPDDAEALALLRSKGGFVVACAQGISGLDEALGYRRRATLLANFNSILYFAGRDDQTDHHALLTLGLQDSPPTSASEDDHGDFQVLERIPAGLPRPVCPPGALARLASHHAYVKLANGSVTNDPLWLEPRFHDFAPTPPPVESDDLATAIAALKPAETDPTNRPVDVPMFLLYMHRQRHLLRLTPSIVAAAWQLCRPRTHPNRILARWSEQIAGLDSLPPCWLIGLHRWLLKNPAMGSTLVAVSINMGILWPELGPASQMWGDGPLSVPESVNRFVYPSLWRPLLPRHWKRLRVDRPDLRAELQSLPQLAEESKTR